MSFIFLPYDFPHATKISLFELEIERSQILAEIVSNILFGAKQTNLE